MTLEEIKNEYANLSALMSLFFIKLDDFVESEIAKKENGEEYNEKVVENGSAIRMHASHALGELVESKACIFDDLTLPDLMCKYQYEKEMSLSLEAYFEQLKKQDKEQTELTDAINDILNDEDDVDKE